jgi:hypothetical protein
MMTDTDDIISRTYSILCGCGKLYVTVYDMPEGGKNVLIHRKSTFACDMTLLDALQRQTTFQTRRELKQAIKDLKGNDDPRLGHRCEKFHIGIKGAIKQGKLAAYSCSDAIARILEREVKLAVS